jgi:hypothetical protein
VFNRYESIRWHVSLYSVTVRFESINRRLLHSHKPHCLRDSSHSILFTKTAKEASSTGIKMLIVTLFFTPDSPQLAIVAPQRTAQALTIAAVAGEQYLTQTNRGRRGDSRRNTSMLDSFACLDCEFVTNGYVIYIFAIFVHI